VRKIILFAVTMLACGPLLADSSAGATGIGAATSQSTFVNQPSNSYDSSDFAERAPTVFVPGLAGGTNPCVVSVALGLSAGAQSSMPAVGVSYGSAHTDEECEVRETLRLAAALTPKQFSSEGERAASQTFLRSIACQSKVMAAAMEMTAKEHGAKYGCLNELPEGADTAMRPLLDRGNDVVMRETPGADQRFGIQYASEVDGVFPEGSGFVH